jgi:hypothetical protein
MAKAKGSKETEEGGLEMGNTPRIMGKHQLCVAKNTRLAVNQVQKARNRHGTAALNGLWQL